MLVLTNIDVDIRSKDKFWIPVYVPTPYEVIKKVPYPVHVPQPYPVIHERKVPVEVRLHSFLDD